MYTNEGIVSLSYQFHERAQETIGYILQAKAYIKRRRYGKLLYIFKAASKIVVNSLNMFNYTNT